MKYPSVYMVCTSIGQLTQGPNQCRIWYTNRERMEDVEQRLQVLRNIQKKTIIFRTRLHYWELIRKKNETTRTRDS